VARYGPPDDPNYPNDEPTAYINYGDDSQPPGEPIPWYRKPVALVAFGALGTVLVALIIFGLVKLVTGGTSPDTPPTTLTPITRTSTSVTAPTTTTAATTTEPTTTEPTTTTTTTEPTTTTTTTTTEPSVSTSISTSTSTSTITQTVTVPPPPP
jgi:cytoskeletal protein RodZ